MTSRAALKFVALNIIAYPILRSNGQILSERELRPHPDILDDILALRSSQQPRLHKPFKASPLVVFGERLGAVFGQNVVEIHICIMGVEAGVRLSLNILSLLLSQAQNVMKIIDYLRFSML